MFLITAFPIRELTEKPTRLFFKLLGRVLRTNLLSDQLWPFRRRAVKSLVLVSLRHLGINSDVACPIVYQIEDDQTVSLSRPLNIRRLITARPDLVLMRILKPWTRLRRRFLGW